MGTPYVGAFRNKHSFISMFCILYHWCSEIFHSHAEEIIWKYNKFDFFKRHCHQGTIFPVPKLPVFGAIWNIKPIFIRNALLCFWIYQALRNLVLIHILSFDYKKMYHMLPTIRGLDYLKRSMCFENWIFFKWSQNEFKTLSVILYLVT